MKEVIERLLQGIPSNSGEELDNIKRELLAAAEDGLEAVQRCFEAAGQDLVQYAEKLASEVKSKVGA